MSDRDLYLKLSSIGISVNNGVQQDKFTDIEQTLVLCAENIPDNTRILCLILSWIHMHGGKVNIERLVKIAGKNPPVWLGAFAQFAVYCKYHRWKKLVFKPIEVVSNGSLTSNQSRSQFKGEEVWSKGSGYLIPLGSEPIQKKWILSPKQLAEINIHYKNKLIYGANWRADIATAIEMGAKNPYQVAKISCCSYEPAHRIFNDFVNAGTIAKVG